MSESEFVTHEGGCHCGRVRFEVEAPADLELHECNCSICSRVGYLHLTVARSNFRLLSGEEDLTTYRFNTGTAQHFFCSACGVKSFYIPRSHPNGYSVNARCLDPEKIRSRKITPFDGSEWEAHIGELPTLED
ncbi:MAG: GFA family protein [Deltaproteobacteria bacterium]|nr:GFA family protein [Deltaproteobacteria bacterium]MBW2394706.1 GFA family protein [Deltaproteobacteria bacterium]